LSSDELIYHLIDPPSPFAPRLEWLEFLADLRSLENPTKAVLREIELTERWIDDHPRPKADLGNELH
jgi:hypothetical protein